MLPSHWNFKTFIRQVNVSSDSPFSQPYQDDQFQPSQGRSVKTVLLIVLSLVLLFCGGFVGLAYMAARSAFGPSMTDLSELETISFENDAEQFNRSLQRTLASTRAADSGETDLVLGADVDSELLAFIEEKLENSVEGIEIPFNDELFIDAVERSPYGSGSLSLLDRIILKTSVTQASPVPDNATQNFRVLAIRHEANPEFAAADILYYSDDNQTQSIQWFLAKVDGRWTIYDWQLLELGQRTSDDYAIFLQGNDSIRHGYDEALTIGYEAEAMWYRGEREAAKRKLRMAEGVRTQTEIRHTKRLHLAYVWMRVSEYKEALRLLESIERPDDIWGVWPSIAVCQRTLGNNKAALEAIEKAALLSPNHPNVYWMRSQILKDMGNNELAVEPAIKSLRLLPKDATALRCVMSLRQPKQLEELITALVDADDELMWRQLINTAYQDEDWSKSLADSFSSREDTPRGALEIVNGHRAWTQERFDEAAASFLSAKTMAERDYIREIASSNHVTLRLENDQPKELFAETEDLSKLLVDLFTDAMYGDIYTDPQRLLDALTVNSKAADSPFHDGLAGWCRFELKQYDKARDDFESMLARLGESSSNRDITHDGDGDGLLETHGPDLEYYIAQCFLKQHNPVAALKRFSEDAGTHGIIGNALMQSKKTSVVRAFVDATKDNSIDSVKLVREKLLAQLSFMGGDDDQCETHHQNSLALAKELFSSDESYQVRRIIGKRAEDLALTRKWLPYTFAVHFGFDGFDEADIHAGAFALEASRLFDVRALNECLQAVRNDSVSEETLANILWRHGMSLEAQGKLQEASVSIRESIEKTDPESIGVLRFRHEKLAHLSLRMGDDESARNSLQMSREIDESNVLVECVIALSKGDLVAVKESLEQLDSDTATEFLQSNESRWYLRQHAASPALRDLINTFPVPLGATTMRTYGSLYFDSDAKIDPALLKTGLQQNSGEQFVLKEVQTDKDQTSRTFVAVSNSERLLFSWGRQSYELDQIPNVLSARFEKPVQFLTINVLDDNPRATERLFSLARCFSENAFVFTWNSQQLIWVGDDLPSQLKWQGRVPIPAKRTFANLYVAEKLERDEDDEVLGTSDWKKILSESADGKVHVHVSLGTEAERIDADLVRVDEDKHQLFVVPRQDSAINPLIKKGLTYRSWSYRVRLVK